MKILTIVGARPQFIKAAAVSRAISKYSQLKEIIVHTGQHFDSNMSEIFFEQMDIPKPSYNLCISNMSHAAMTGRMMEQIELVCLSEKPNIVLVYGDTNSTLAGALVAAKLSIPIAHVEAGLRSFNMNMPEEINRVLTDKVSTILFCPTDAAVENLQREGYGNGNSIIHKPGDVMHDTAIYYKSLAKRPSSIPLIEANCEFALSTLHRAENVDDDGRLADCIRALNKVNQEIPVLMPIHPRTKAAIVKLGITPSFHLMDPVGYLEMIYLLQNASVVLTDSGGLQKESFFFGKPCVALREETEWTELVDAGCVTVTGSNPEKIYNAYSKNKKLKIENQFDLYGGGQASQNIVYELQRFLDLT